MTCFLRRLLQILTAFLLLAAVATQSRLEGGASSEWAVGAGSPPATAPEVSFVVGEGAGAVRGYGGAVPLTVYLKNDRVARVEVRANRETPDFLEYVIGKGLLERWNGLTLSEVASLEVDAVTGATYTSTAIIRNMQSAERVAPSDSFKEGERSSCVSSLSANVDRGWGYYAACVVLLVAIVVPFFFRGKWYRNLQLVLNVLVLGFWTGSFVSLQLFVNLIANGIQWTDWLVLLLLIAAIVLPLFGKRQHYCTWVCPLGSCQELLGRVLKKKLHLPVKLVKGLDLFRQALWVVILLTMWTGLTLNYLGCELFTAFLFRQAPTVVVVLAVVFLILSCFVQRPYCRFVCPTGSILKFMEKK